MKFVVSNDLSFLADILKDDIFKGNLFEKRLLILPSKQIKAWLINYWTDSGLQAIGGIQFFSLQSSINYLLNCIKSHERHFPTSLELKLLIYYFLNNLDQMEIDAVLKTYLEEDRNKRLVYLSDVLADLFQNYAIYGFNFRENLKNSKNWQEKLFYKIFYEKKYSNLLKEYPFKGAKNTNLKIYLFGFSYLPEIYFEFFQSLDMVSDLYIYYPRITGGFWEDIQSNKQTKFIQKNFYNFLPSQDWTGKMYEINSFFANFGVLGKRYEKILGNYDLHIEENYIVDDKSTTLLNKFQKDILELISLDDELIDVEENECSINIHEVNGSCLEEIKIIYEKIQANLKDPNVSLNDIVVLAPNINQYIPYIKTIFNRKNGSIDFKIDDVELLLTSHLAKGIDKILSLSDSDWEIDDVFSLLDNPLVQKKFKLQKFDIEFFYHLLQETKLKFSYDESHKSKLFGYKNNKRTWDESFRKIILAYATFSAEFECDKYPQTFINLGQSDLKIIEPMFKIVSSLYDDINDFKKKTQLPLKLFAEKLNLIIEKYFFIPDVLIEQMALDCFRSFTYKFSNIELDVEISFEHFCMLLMKDLKTKTTSFNSHLCDAIQFGSIGHDKWPNFKYVYLIGINSSYPTNKPKSSLDLLGLGKYPTKMQFDRFAFLSMIMKTKKSLWISYPSQSLSGNVLPSMFIQELSSFLNKHYKINNMSFSEWNETAELVKKDIKNVQLNQGLLINCPSSNIKEKSIEITTYDLTQLAKCPISFYLQKKHQINFPNLFDKIDEDFFLTPLNRAIFLKDYIFSSDEMNQKNDELLPSGVFQNVARFQLNQKIHDLTKKAINFNIDLKSLIEFELIKDLDKPIINQKKIYLPALKLNLNNRNVTIVGKIKNIHPKGMIIFKGNTFYEWVKNWPTILIFGLFAKQNNCLGNVYFLESNSEKNISNIKFEKSLKRYLRYYFVMSETIFPFTKSLCNNVIKGDILAFKQTLHQLQTKNLQYQDPLEKWFAKHFISNVDKTTFVSWTKYLNYVFYPILNEI